MATPVGSVNLLRQGSKPGQLPALLDSTKTPVAPNPLPRNASEGPRGRQHGLAAARRRHSTARVVIKSITILCLIAVICLLARRQQAVDEEKDASSPSAASFDWTESHGRTLLAKGRRKHKSHHSSSRKEHTKHRALPPKPPDAEEDDDDKCAGVQATKVADRCEYVRTHCGSTLEGWVNYLSLHYCTFHGMETLSVLVLVSAVLLFFYVLGETAESYFCPVVEKITELLDLAPTTAGVTFLAFGNGSPDVFSSLAAFVHGNPKIGLGAIVSAGSFVTAFVVGCVSVVAAPFTVEARSFVRDVLFFLVASLGVYFVCSLGAIRVWQAVLFCVYYVVYVTVVIISDRLSKAHPTSSSSSSAAASTTTTQLLAPPDESTLPEEAFDGVKQWQHEDKQWLDPSHLDKERALDRERTLEKPHPPSHHHHRHQHRTTDSGPLQQPLSVPGQRRSVSILATGGLPSNIATVPTGNAPSNMVGSGGAIPPLVLGSVPSNNLAPSNIALPPNFAATGSIPPLVLATGTATQNALSTGTVARTGLMAGGVSLGPNTLAGEPGELEHLLAKHRDPLNFSRQVEPAAPHLDDWGDDALSLDLDVRVPFQLYYKEWKEEFLSLPTAAKVRTLLYLPFDVLRRATIPSVEDAQWNRLYATANVLLCPLVILDFCSGLVEFDHPIGFAFVGYFPLWGLVLIQSLILAVSLFVTTSSGAPPPHGRAPMVAGAFVMSIMWISTIANELLGCLNALGIIVGVSPSVLGVTVLAWGNSIGDLVADVAIARAGLPAMALSGCYAGPLFNMMVGLGLALTIKTIMIFPAPYKLHRHPNIPVAFGFLFASLVGSLTVVSLCQFRMTRAWGACLIAMYLSFTLLSILMESGLVLGGEG